MRDRARTAGLLLCAWLSGCSATKVDATADEARARSLIEASTGREGVYDPRSAPMSGAEIDSVLRDGLTLDESLRLALLNNRRLQAEFATLGMARADLVQAGLLQNPGASIAFLFPSNGGRPKISADLFAR